MKRLFPIALALAATLVPCTYGQNKSTPIATPGMPAPMMYDYGDPITLGYPCDASHMGLPFYNLNASITRPIWICKGDVWVQALPALTGTTVSIGGAVLLLNGTTSGTATVPGAVTGQVCAATTSDGSIITNLLVLCNVTAANTVTVTLQAIGLGSTPPAKTYNVRILQ